jgi:hypothetical protein
MGAASIGMDSVFEVGLKLLDVKESAYYGARALKLNGQMVACTPLNKSSEVNSVVVAMSFERGVLPCSRSRRRSATSPITTHRIRQF